MEGSMDGGVLTVSDTEFQAKCLELFDDLKEHKVSKVIVTHDGKPVAELTPPQGEPPRLFGAHRGSVVIPPGVDLTKPTFDDGDFDYDERNLLS
jgi:hypothetical protein